MIKTTHRFRAYEVRKITHPKLPGVEKYWLTVRALDFPASISTAANARDPIGLNRRVYRDVRHRHSRAAECIRLRKRQRKAPNFRIREVEYSAGKIC